MNVSGHRVILASLELRPTRERDNHDGRGQEFVLDTVRKAIADGDVDFLGRGVRVPAQAVMEAEVTEVTELTGVPKGERDPGAWTDEPEPVPRPALGDLGRDGEPLDPPGPRRLVLPVSARAAPARRAGPSFDS
jgi:hypothetical protein